MKIELFFDCFRFNYFVIVSASDRVEISTRPFWQAWIVSKNDLNNLSTNSACWIAADSNDRAKIYE